MLLKRISQLFLFLIVLFVVFVILIFKFGPPQFWLPSSKQGNLIDIADLLITPEDLGSSDWAIQQGPDYEPRISQVDYRENNLFVVIDNKAGVSGLRHQVFLTRNIWDSKIRYKQLVEDYETILTNDDVISIRSQFDLGDKYNIFCEQHIPEYKYYCRSFIQVDEFISVITYSEQPSMNGGVDINDTMDRLNQLAYNKFIDAGIREK